MKEIELIIEHSKHFRIRYGEIKYIIIHCSTKSPYEQVKQLDQLGLSAHFIIGRDGEIVENLSVDNVAYHAGISSWDKSLDKSLNEYSIGIELEAPTLGQLKSDYTNKQIRSLLNLLDYLVVCYGIRKENILGHSDIAPERKPDPGIGFPWKTLANHGFGLWYDLRSLDKSIDDVELLDKIGYNVDNLKATRIAFCRHFLPSEVDKKVEVKWLVDNVFDDVFEIKNKEKYLKTLRAVAKVYTKNKEK